jgi:hypothetical protein
LRGVTVIDMESGFDDGPAEGRNPALVMAAWRIRREGPAFSNSGQVIQ